MPRIAYVNGRYVPHAQASVHVEDRGFQFADSIYEVIALMNGRLADEEGHLDRLERSLSELRIALPMPRKSIRIVMRELVRRNRLKNGSIYMQVTRGQAQRDFKFPKGISPSFVMIVYNATYDTEARKKAVKKVVTVPDLRWKRRDIKSTALLPQVLAKQAAADKGAYEAWMIDDDGYISEGSSSNAWIVDGKGNLVTRPTANNRILKGVTRNALQALCKREKIKIIERAFTAKEAYKAKEAFTSSATALIAPVGEIDGHKIGNGKCGKITAKLFDLYMDYARDNPPPQQERWNPK
ncbi:MAG: D-amino-acid transaminase [Alphaproteobacteria bacterium]|nr:D-amino-acid transaminase [Alphaproteobacteria bacterium]